MNRIATIPDGKILDYIDGKLRNDTPEEYVRQTIERRLVEEHRYPVNQIAVEFTLKNGSRRPRADIVIFGRDSDRVQSAIRIIVECKKSTINPSATKDGIEQLKSYMSLCVNCEWGMWTNSVQRFVFRKVEDRATGERIFEEYNDIPSAEGNIAEIDRPTRNNLKNAVDDNLLFVFRTCHDYIYANDGLHKDKAFFEFLKIIFCKIEDEKNFPRKLDFYATSLERKNPDGQLTVKNRIEKIFSRVKLRYPQIFSDTDSLGLIPRSLARVVSELQKYSLLNTNIDIKGKAYEEIVGANLRGDRGEFFTPRNVMKMVVAMIDPELDERVLDSSCGTGGFPVIAMTHVKTSLKKFLLCDLICTRIEPLDEARNFPRTVSTVSLLLCLAGSASDQSRRNSITTIDRLVGVAHRRACRQILNVPYLYPNLARGLTSSEAHRKRAKTKILRYPNCTKQRPVLSLPEKNRRNKIKREVAFFGAAFCVIWTFDENSDTWHMTNRLQSSVPPEILFVERCTQFLKPGGRMGIVLPDSILGSPGLGYIRTWIIRNHKILASIDLHADTFQPHNGTQTSVLILRKKMPEEILSEERHGIIDYEIFMAQVEKVGHDKRGNPTFKRDDDGREILVDNVKVLDDETADVALVYNGWKKKLPVAAQIKFCAVKLSDIQSHGLRLEASVYDLDAMKVRQAVLKNSVPFDNFASSYVCGRFKRVWVEKSDFPIYQPSAITEIKPKPDGYISSETATDIDALRVHSGQVLLTCSGTIGKVSFVSQTLNGKIFSHDLLRIDTKNDYDAGYIYTWLKSSVGQQILLTNSYGAVIEHIEPEHLENIPVPVASESLKRQIHGLIARSYELRDESNELIDEAERILINELHLPDIDDFEREKIFSVKLSDLRGRLDASFHSPLVERIVKHLKAHAAEVTTIADSRISRRIVLAGVFKRTYVDKGFGYPFLGGREITQLNPDVEKYLSKVVHQERYEKELRVSENMLLVTDRGTIGKVALVPKHWKDYAVSQNVLKVIPTSSDIVGYLYVYLNSDIGEALIKRETYGAVVDMIDDKSLGAVPVPLLRNVAAQFKMNSMALLANEKRFRAYLLEQEALKILNDKVLVVQ